jgi:hypothetical protein
MLLPLVDLPCQILMLLLDGALKRESEFPLSVFQVGVPFSHFLEEEGYVPSLFRSGMSKPDPVLTYRKQPNNDRKRSTRFE